MSARCSLALFLSLRDLVARAQATTNVSGIPGPLHDPEMLQFYNGTTTRATAAAIATCKTYPAGQTIPWSVVARDWFIGGGRKEDCAAALIVASGETSCTAEGCVSVQSGIWQVTSPDQPAPSGCPDGSFNPCCTVDYVRNHMNTPTSYQVSCMGEFNDGNGWPGAPSNPKATKPPSNPIELDKVVGPTVPKDHSGAGLGGTQSNWIGPFCHQGGTTCESNDSYCHSHSQTTVSGDNWGGGSEWKGVGGKQIFPWPYYYYARFVESLGDGKGMTEMMHCDTTTGLCGAIPSQQLSDCQQPTSGEAPKDQQCFNRITELAIKLASQICEKEGNFKVGADVLIP